MKTIITPVKGPPLRRVLCSFLCGAAVKSANQRRKSSAVFKIMALLVLWLGWSMPAIAQALVSLPYSEDGIANGAPYEIIVPGNWKDTDYTLVVFLHGYVGVECPLVPPLGPNSQWTDDNGTDSEPALLGLGYALAASSYSRNGFAVKQGFDDTRHLIEHFKSRIGRPGRTILVAQSLGTLSAFKLMEDSPRPADGAIAIGDFGAGTPLLVDYVLVATLAYDVAFEDTPSGGWNPNWGPFANPKPGLLYCSGAGSCDGTGCAPTDPASQFNAQINDPANFGRFEFIRLVLGLTDISTAQWLTEGGVDVPTYLGTEGLAELHAHIEADAGQTFSGGLAQNLNHIYTLTQAQITHLASLGIDAPTLLARMNARRIYTRDPVADAYERAWFNPTGQITGPEILMKDIGDSVAPQANDFYYLKTVQAAGTQGSVLELFRPKTVHPGWFVSQLTQVLAAMHAWIATGNRPTPDWVSFGFQPFNPKPFPYLPN